MDCSHQGMVFGDINTTWWRNCLNYFLSTISFVIRDPQRLLMKVVSSSLPLLSRSNILYYLPKFDFWPKFSTQTCISRLFSEVPKNALSCEVHSFLLFPSGSVLFTFLLLVTYCLDANNDNFNNNMLYLLWFIHLDWWNLLGYLEECMEPCMDPPICL
jgi:hypothetical protein